MPESSLSRKAKQALSRALGLPGALGPTPEHLEMERRLDAILEGLSPEQQEHVLAELNDPEVKRPPGRRLSNLTSNIIALAISSETPPVMHPAVAQVYVEDPRASAYQDCEDCGLDVPGVFDRCPNCGGHVGYASYFHKRVMPLERLRACAETARRGDYRELVEKYERMIADREREVAHGG